MINDFWKRIILYFSVGFCCFNLYSLLLRHERIQKTKVSAFEIVAYSLLHYLNNELYKITICESGVSIELQVYLLFLNQKTLFAQKRKTKIFFVKLRWFVNLSEIEVKCAIPEFFSLGIRLSSDLMK